MDAFDADVLIYAAAPDDPLGRPVRQLFDAATTDGTVGVGSVLLLPEVLTKPRRAGRDEEVSALLGLLSRLTLLPLDVSTARLSVSLGSTYGLRPADAAHLATAVVAGATRFITNNTEDFSREIAEIQITDPADLLSSTQGT
ncbi:hypothetical protein BJF80_02880 [Serinicoccus sp. CUA-874]|uniref:type II toxin-antitoxin system VapC family toxin n=1 Tax=Serinicoccus sp. CUA-874 TaxID=1517939 RepID=UPI00096148C9|nr:type II toxin-antitoxin system VapC family toxin [Serinicoccus sp. CUA-874]OLT17148.1 hypothetical protein BJF80_02880 [Serinicoccus sp. CUA-874]